MTCKGTECEGEHPLPYPYPGPIGVQRVANALVKTAKTHGFPMDEALPYEQQGLVGEARGLFLCAALAMMMLYFPEGDCHCEGLGVLAGMEEQRKWAESKTPFDMIFEEIKTGLKIVLPQREYVPCDLVRGTDYMEPAENTHRDGTHGFNADEDDAVMFYDRYRICLKKLKSLGGSTNFEFIIKRPLAIFGETPLSIFNETEKKMIDLEERTSSLNKFYEMNLMIKGDYDLLDRLMIESIMAYIKDTAVPLAARKSYMTKLQTLVNKGVRSGGNGGRRRKIQNAESGTH